MDNLIPPHGSTLVDLMAGSERASEIRERSRDWPSVDLGPRQLCDLELLLNGGYSPLTGYLGEKDHLSVCTDSRLVDGTLWPVPVILDIGDDDREGLKQGDTLALRDGEGVMLAALEVEEIWRPDRLAEARALFGTDDPENPAVKQHLHRGRVWAVAGRVEGVQLPVHHDYRELRLTPRELRRKFSRLGWRRVIAYQTHRTVHRAQQAALLRAAGYYITRQCG